MHRLTAVFLSLLALAAASDLDPATVSSCDEWTTRYQPHWNTFPECHEGSSNQPCCDLYHLMTRTVRVFTENLGCHIPDKAAYTAKFAAHCSEKLTRTAGKPVEPGHGTDPVEVLDVGESTAEHSGGGGCVGGHCGCVGGDCGHVSPCTGGHCGGCSGGHCGGCSGGNCGGCSGGHCGGCSGGHCGCTGGGCSKPVPVGVCVGINCGCTQCAPAQPGTTAGQTNQGPIFIPDDDGEVCFHGDGSVQLEDGGTKLMKELSVGDVVYVGSGKFSQVFMFTHQDAHKRARYVRMTVGSGESVMVTPTHYMYGGKGAQLASEFGEGDTLEMQDGRMEKIVTLTVVYDKGLYNPQTLHGDIVVNGFRASTYTKAIEYETAHSLLAPLRAMYRICGAHISAAF